MQEQFLLPAAFLSVLLPACQRTACLYLLSLTSACRQFFFSPSQTSLPCTYPVPLPGSAYPVPTLYTTRPRRPPDARRSCHGALTTAKSLLSKQIAFSAPVNNFFTFTYPVPAPGRLPSQVLRRPRWRLLASRHSWANFYFPQNSDAPKISPSQTSLPYTYHIPLQGSTYPVPPTRIPRRLHSRPSQTNLPCTVPGHLQHSSSQSNLPYTGHVNTDAAA